MAMTDDDVVIIILTQVISQTIVNYNNCEEEARARKSSNIKS